MRRSPRAARSKSSASLEHILGAAIDLMVHSPCRNEPMPVYAPMLSPEARAAADKAEALAAARRQPRPGRRPAACTLTPAFNETERRWVPRFRLEGKWLEALGFTAGGRASIEVREDGALVLMPMAVPSATDSPVARRPKRKRAEAAGTVCR